MCECVCVGVFVDPFFPMAVLTPPPPPLAVMVGWTAAVHATSCYNHPTPPPPQHIQSLSAHIVLRHAHGTLYTEYTHQDILVTHSTHTEEKWFLSDCSEESYELGVNLISSTYVLYGRCHSYSNLHMYYVGTYNGLCSSLYTVQCTYL